MVRVFIESDHPPEGDRVFDHFDMPEVPSVGEQIEIISTGRHTALRVKRVVWKQGDDGFMPVLRCAIDE